MSFIDVLSNHGWLLRLKSKYGNEIKGALTKLCEQTKIRPVLVQIDKETEFLDSHVQNLLKKYQIRLFTTFSERKASIVERFNCTIKGIMFRLFTRNSNRRYIHLLNETTHTYNNSHHGSIKIKPIQVSKENEPQVCINLYENRFKHPQTASQRSWFSTGDLVRISIDQGPFKRLFRRLERRIIFCQACCCLTVYKLQNQPGEDIMGTFYSKEIQKIAEPEGYRIVKVIRKK